MQLSKFTLLTSVGLLLTGHGIQLTLLPLYADHLAWSANAISVTGASYFAGFMLGSLLIPMLLTRAGYIRVFLTFAALMAVVILCLSLIQNLYAWMALRFITGVCIVAIYLTTESWLNASTGSANRGKILSIYALVTLSGVGLGQTLVGLLALDTLFQVCAIVMLLALLPVGLFCNDEPEVPAYAPPKLTDLKQLPGFIIAAMFLGAVMAGSIWSVAPLFGKNYGLSPWEISLMMNALVFGAVFFQIPLGLLSDRHNRKHVISTTALACLLVVCLIPMASNNTQFLFLFFIFGGLSLTQYALCAAFANEESTLGNVKVAALILMLNGAGSVTGPLLIALLSSYMASALLWVSGTSMLLILLSALVLPGPGSNILAFPKVNTAKEQARQIAA